MLGRRNDIPAVDYEAACRRTKADWARELRRIENRTFLEKALVVQILQCYAKPAGRHPNRSDPALGEHVWYTTSQEIRFYRAFRRIGRNDLAERVKAASLKFAVTREGLVGERYHDANPWFLPWSPNASAPFRTGAMRP